MNFEDTAAYYETWPWHSRDNGESLRLPTKIRMLKTVRADFPFLYVSESPHVARLGEEYLCSVNKLGAVSVCFEDGELLGVKLDEFEVIESIKKKHETAG